MAQDWLIGPDENIILFIHFAEIMRAKAKISSQLG